MFHIHYIFYRGGLFRRLHHSFSLFTLIGFYSWYNAHVQLESGLFRRQLSQIPIFKTYFKIFCSNIGGKLK